MASELALKVKSVVNQCKYNINDDESNHISHNSRERFDNNRKNENRNFREDHKSRDNRRLDDHFHDKENNRKFGFNSDSFFHEDNERGKHNKDSRINDFWKGSTFQFNDHRDNFNGGGKSHHTNSNRNSNNNRKKHGSSSFDRNSDRNDEDDKVGENYFNQRRIPNLRRKPTRSKLKDSSGHSDLSAFSNLDDDIEPIYFTLIVSKT